MRGEECLHSIGVIVISKEFFLREFFLLKRNVLEHNCEHRASKGKDVRFVDQVARGIFDFRSSIDFRTYQNVLNCANLVGMSEINEYQSEIVSKHHVVWLNITMSDKSFRVQHKDSLA